MNISEKAVNSRWAFIVNPTAGGGRAERYIHYLKNFKDTLHPCIDLFTTDHRGHAVKICDRLMEEGYRRFVAVGGDGTFNEVIQSLAKRDDCVLGVFPAGTGNDYAPGAGFSDLYEPKDLAELFRANEVPVDVGVCNDRFFLNNFGAGFDAKVAHDFEKAKSIPPALRYWFCILKNIFQFSPSMLSLTGNRKKRILASMLISVGIGRSCGGGFYLTPRAYMNDGLFDVCVISNSSVFSRIRKLLSIKLMRHIGRKGTEYFNANAVTVEFDDEMPAHLDGEIFYGKRFDLSILPSRIRLLVLPGRENYLKA